MKKKIASIIAAAAALSIAGGALVACGGDDDDKGNSVTAEQWTAAFDFTVITDFKVDTVAEEKIDGKDVGKSEATYTFDGENYLSEMILTEYAEEEGGEDEVSYMGNCTVVSEGTPAYYRYQSDSADAKPWTTAESGTSAASNKQHLLPPGIEAMYEKFTYNEEKGDYIVNDASELGGDMVSFTLTFKGDKVSRIDYTMEDGGEGSPLRSTHVSCTVTYGDQTVPAPTVAA